MSFLNTIFGKHSGITKIGKGIVKGIDDLSEKLKKTDTHIFGKLDYPEYKNIYVNTSRDDLSLNFGDNYTTLREAIYLTRNKNWSDYNIIFDISIIEGNRS